MDSAEWGVIKTTPTIRHLHNHRIPTTTPDLLDPTMEILVTSAETKAVMVEDLMADLQATATVIANLLEAFLETLEVHHLEATLDTTLEVHHLEAAVLVLETAAEEAVIILAMAAEEAVLGLVVEAVEEVLTLSVKT